MAKRKQGTTVKSIRKNKSGKKRINKPPVAWQNKDIIAKCFGENLKGKSFAVYGLDLPDIMEVQPTNLPAIEANELRLDNLFLLKDRSLALVDYESGYADANKIKYLNYIVRTMKRNMEQQDFPCKIRMIVIYTADIDPGQTERELDIGCLQFQLEEVFLSEMDSPKIEARLQGKFQQKEVLTKEDQMEFVILPLTYKGEREKQACIRRCFDMAKTLEDEKTQRFLLSGMLVFADKVVTKEDSKQIKEWIMMTKVAQLFEEEKIEYGEVIRREVTESVTRDVTESVTRDVTESVKISLVWKKCAKNKSLSEIADELETKPDEILPIYNLIIKNPGKTAEEICQLARPENGS